MPKAGFRFGRKPCGQVQTLIAYLSSKGDLRQLSWEDSDKELRRSYHTVLPADIDEAHGVYAQEPAAVDETTVRRIFNFIDALVAAFALLRGDAFRIVNGMDSFGNTCGRKNMPLVRTANSTMDSILFPLSGLDMTDKNDGSILSRCIPNDFVTIAIDMLSSLHEFIQDQDWIRVMTAEAIFVRAEIGAICFLSVGFSSFLWHGWYVAYNRNETSLTTMGSAQALVALPEVSEKTMLIFAVAMTIITVLLLVTVWCVWPRGALVVDLFRESGRALAAMPFLLLQPILTCVILVAFLAYWAVIAVQLYTSAPAVPSVIVRSNGERIDAVTFNVTDQIRYMGWYHIVGLVWTTEFIFASHRMVVAGAVAIWYFKRRSSPWCTSLATLINYHLGSIALGSFIITLVKLPRYVFMYAHAKLKESENFMAKYVLRCMISVLKCVENCLRCLHHNAYTIIAISGQSFFPAAKTAANILLDNAVDVATINTVGDFVLFLAKCIVTTACLSVAVFRFKFQLALNYWMIEAGVVGIVAYISASCFLSVIEMVIDTLFLCFAHDNDNVTKSHGSTDYADRHFKEYMSTTLDRERALGVVRRWNHADRGTVEQLELAVK
ncbi:Choline transporter-like protein 1 [Toxocara canis]|uniref:Choline transporter-like protein n=1 Tax=Toxocara canis TaxID=6265 RepID=A0A0B2UNH7_TOXCA|nr:Choline transporter-like protein 1 [Toxocara canis]